MGRIAQLLHTNVRGVYLAIGSAHDLPQDRRDDIGTMLSAILKDISDYTSSDDIAFSSEHGTRSLSAISWKLEQIFSKFSEDIERSGIGAPGSFKTLNAQRYRPRETLVILSCFVKNLNKYFQYARSGGDPASRSYYLHATGSRTEIVGASILACNNLVLLLSAMALENGTAGSYAKIYEFVSAIEIYQSLWLNNQTRVTFDELFSSLENVSNFAIRNPSISNFDIVYLNLRLPVLMNMSSISVEVLRKYNSYLSDSGEEDYVAGDLQNINATKDEKEVAKKLYLQSQTIAVIEDDRIGVQNGPPYSYSERYDPAEVKELIITLQHAAGYILEDVSHDTCNLDTMIRKEVQRYKQALEMDTPLWYLIEDAVGGLTWAYDAYEDEPWPGSSRERLRQLIRRTSQLRPYLKRVAIKKTEEIKADRNSISKKSSDDFISKLSDAMNHPDIEGALDADATLFLNDNLNYIKFHRDNKISKLSEKIVSVSGYIWSIIIKVEEKTKHIIALSKALDVLVTLGRWILKTFFHGHS